MKPQNTCQHTHELVTESLDESLLQDILELVVRFLSEKGVEYVRVEFGYVAQRDLRGEAMPEDRTVPVNELVSLIENGLQQGTIEWPGTSDFIFSAVGTEVNFKLCNDADLHFSSSDLTLLKELSLALTTANGVKVYE